MSNGGKYAKAIEVNLEKSCQMAVDSDLPGDEEKMEAVENAEEHRMESETGISAPPVNRDHPGANAGSGTEEKVSEPTPAPAGRKPDGYWDLATVCDWAETISDPLPPRDRTLSDKAVITGTGADVLTICRSLLEAKLEKVAESVAPQKGTTGNFTVVGLAPNHWSQLDEVLGNLQPLRKNGGPVKAVPPPRMVGIR
jgi:hypothetical protein